jgi:bacteriochlorophyll 4-vinyl reductase
MAKRIPSWLWRIVLQCTTDHIGEKGTTVVLRRCGLEEAIGSDPEDDETPSITVKEFSHYIKALFDIFGEEGAKPILLRSGKIGFISAYERMPAPIKAARTLVRVLPEKKRLIMVIREFSKAFDETMGTAGNVRTEGEKIVVEIPDCPYCKGITTETPACYVEIGLLFQLIETAVGTGYTVRETHCMAAGDDVCRFVIEKAP